MSSKQNIIYIYFKGKHLITSKSQYQYNHGQFLYFADLNLPQAFEVHFSNKDKGDSKTQIGSNKLVEIPDEYFWNGALMIYAWIYLHSETTDGETVYEVRMPLIKRAKPTDEEPLPQQQGTIDRAIAELNNAIETTTENANKTEADKTIVANIKEDVISLKEDIDDTATVVGQKAQETINASERAEASAQNAAQYESNALNYSQQAEQSAQQVLESKNIASQKAEVATNASSEALGYRDETNGYRNETLGVRNDVQTLKGQIDETAEAISADAQSTREDADFLRNANAIATTLDADSDATVELNDGQFAFGIPRGEDAINIQIDTDAVVIHTGSDGIFTKDETIKIHTAFYDGKTLKSVSPRPPKIKLKKRINETQWMYVDKTATVSFGFEHDVTYVLTKGWQLYTEPFIINIDFVYEGVTYTRNIPLTVVKDGAKGDTGNGISSAILNDDYTLTLTFTDGTTYTTPSIRGEKGDKGDKIYIGNDGSIYME